MEEIRVKYGIKLIASRGDVNVNMKRHLNEINVGFYENVWELIRRIDTIQKGINVVVLDEITASGIKKVDGTWEYFIGFSFSHQIHNFCLVLLVEIQLAGQRDSPLQNHKKVMVLS